MTIGLALLIPFEATAMIRHPSLARLALMFVNALVVAYLANRRLTAGRTKMR